MLDFHLAYWFSVHKSLVTGTQIGKLNLSGRENKLKHDQQQLLHCKLLSVSIESPENKELYHQLKAHCLHFKHDFGISKTIYVNLWKLDSSGFLLFRRAVFDK